MIEQAHDERPRVLFAQRRSLLGLVRQGAFQQAAERSLVDRAAEEEALGNVAPDAFHELDLLGGFDALANHDQAQHLGDVRHRVHHGRVAEVGKVALEKQLIDLHFVDRQVLQHAQRRVPAAEIVHRHAETVLVQPLDLADHGVEILDERAFGDFGDRYDGGTA